MKNCGESNGLKIMLLEKRVAALEKKTGLRALESVCDRLNINVRNDDYRKAALRQAEREHVRKKFGKK